MKEAVRAQLPVLKENTEFRERPTGVRLTKLNRGSDCA